MPQTAQELYQEFLNQKQNQAKQLYNEFSRKREEPLIEQESQQRIAQNSEQALKSFFQFPPQQPLQQKPTLIDYSREIGPALMSLGINIGIGTLGGLEKTVKETMPTGDYKRIMEQEHPGIKKTERLIGTVGRYAGFGKIFAPLAPAIANIDALRFLGPAYQVGIGSAVSRAATWGASKLADNLSKVATDMQDPTIKNMLIEPIEAGGWGAALGAAQAVGLPIGSQTTLGKLEGSFAHLILAGAIGGSREGADKLTDMLTGKKLNMQDVMDIGTSALFTGVIEAIGHQQLKEVWQKAEMSGYYANKTIQKIMDTTGVSKAQATKEAEFLSFLSDIQNKPAYVQTMENHVPKEFYQYQPDAQVRIVNHLVDNIKTEGMSFSEAFGSAMATVGAIEKPKLLPSAQLPDPKPMKTVNQVKKGHVLQNQLKKVGWTEKEISDFKGNKSFKVMSKEEATRVINKMESAINLSDDLAQTSDESKDAIKKKITKRILGMEKKITKIQDYKDLIIKSTPPELLNYNGKSFRSLDYIRPSRRAFRRDPFVYFNGYLPIYDSYSNFKIGYEEKAAEAINKAKKLNLTIDELKDIDYRRQLMYFKNIKQNPKLQNVPIPELNDRQKEFDDYLTRQYQWAHPYFGIKGYIPPHMYSPLLRERQQMEEAILGSFFPEKLPEFMDAFFHHERTSAQFDGLKTDALENYLKYMKSGFKKKFMEPVMKNVRANVLSNPHVKGSMKKAIEAYGTWMLGWPTAMDESYVGMFKELGLNPEDAQQLTQVMMDLIYSSVISPRPTLLAKQLLQNLNTANELGYNWTVTGFMDFLQNGFDEARNAGVISDYAIQTHIEPGTKKGMAKFEGSLAKVRELMTWAFRWEDRLGRTVAYYAAKNKWDYHHKRAKNIPDFIKRAGIDNLDKTEQFRIRDNLRKGNIYEARRIFFKEIVGKVHYKYGKQDSPLVTKWRLGKLFMQLHTWPENYAELVAENVRNENTGFLLRQLMAIIAISWLGYAANQKWMIGYPATSLPTSRYKLKQFLGTPVAFQALEDLLVLIADPGFRWMYSHDPEKAEKLFQKHLKTLRKDLLLYIPGGLALKDLYGTKDFIPFKAPGSSNVLNLKNIVQ